MHPLLHATRPLALPRASASFNQRPDPLQWWRDTVHYALKGSSEQYFIRIMSAQPLEELHGDAGFQVVLRALAKLGLAASEKPKTEG